MRRTAAKNAQLRKEGVRCSNRLWRCGEASSMGRAGSGSIDEMFLIRISLLPPCVSWRSLRLCGERSSCSN
jgi:hypothetical protein